jgi:hypothetical protein
MFQPKARAILRHRQQNVALEGIRSHDGCGGHEMSAAAPTITINGEGAAPTVFDTPIPNRALPGDEQRDLLLRAMADLREVVGAEPLASKRDAAFLHVDFLDDAVSREEPDLRTVRFVAEWFRINLPDAGGLVDAIAEVAIRRQWVTELAAWKLAVERAGRYNRNLLQYGASIAAFLGISAGGGGILALAKAVTMTQGEKAGQLLSVEALQIVIALGVVGLIGAAVLCFLLYRAFRARSSAEADADEHLETLVRLRPENFVPSASA